MSKPGFYKSCIMAGLCLFQAGHAAAQDLYAGNELIWMNSPGDLTKTWESQVFHLGNGWFGASCDGGIQQEIFTLGEKTFWTGGPGDQQNNDYGIVKGNVQDLDSIKHYTSIGDFHASDKFASRLFSSDLSTFGTLSSIGELYINFFKKPGEVKGYKRALNLSDATASVQYTIGDTRFCREYFCSYPDRVLAMRMTSDKPDALRLNIGVNLMHKVRNPRTNVSAADGTIEVVGNIDDNNRPYRLIIKVVCEDGKIRQHGSSLNVSGSQSVVIFYTVATDYTMTPPLYKGADPEAITQKVIQKVTAQGYEKTKKIHVSDYKSLYDRTAFHLENEAKERESLPTNERLNFYIRKHDFKDLGLKELAFNFGKYILISSSRPGALPAGLQGCWNNKYHARWFGTYQLDMNVTQTYMFGNALNLPECQQPFIDYIKDKAETGKEAAKAYYGLDSWASFMIGNIWGHVGILDNLILKFSSTGWLSVILWEQYAFEGNLDYLKEIYPILKAASLFYRHNLAEYKNTGELVYAGDTSAEHYSPMGATVPGFQDIAFAQETFKNTIRAAEILHTDKSFRKGLQKTTDRLMPHKIGRFGQLQEWVEDIDDPNCKHRHMSQLMSLLPCSLFNPYQHPDWTEAAKVTLEHRGDADWKALHGIGCNSPEHPSRCLHEGLPYDFYTAQVWCRAARMCNWIRLFDGDRADKIYNDILCESTLENMIQYETKANYSDEPDSTPFFLDGTVLSAGYVTEMVLQSQHGFLDILPALPSCWKTGYLKGIRARGGFTVDVEWQDSKLVQAVIKSDKNAVCKIHYRKNYYTGHLFKDRPYVFRYDGL